MAPAWATGQAQAVVAEGGVAGVVLGVQKGGMHGSVGSTNGGGLVVVVGGAVSGAPWWSASASA